jgi:hypothetical protein
MKGENYGEMPSPSACPSYDGQAERRGNSNPFEFPRRPMMAPAVLWRRQPSYGRGTISPSKNRAFQCGQPSMDKIPVYWSFLANSRYR